MLIGSMDRRIELQADGGGTDDRFGGKGPESFATYATVWARVLPAQGNQRDAGGQISGDATYKFTIRYRDDVTIEHRIAYRGNFYDIISPPVEIGRREFTEILARLRQSPQ